MKVEDLSDQVAFGLIMMKIYDGLLTAGKTHLMNHLLEEFEEIWKLVVLREISLETLQRIQYFVEKAPGLKETETANGIVRDAQIYSLGLSLHETFPPEDSQELNICGSLVLASDLLAASQGDPAPIKFVIEPMPGIQSHGQISAFIKALSGQARLWNRFGTELAGPFDNLGQMEEQILWKYFKYWLVYNSNDKEQQRMLHLQLEQALRRILKDKILTLRHLQCIGENEPNIFWENVLSFFQLILHYRLTKIPVEFFKVHSVALHSKTFQKHVLGELLVQNYAKGRKETADVVKQLLELNPEVQLCPTLEEQDLLLIVKDVRMGRLTHSGRNAYGRSTSKWSLHHIKEWALSIKQQQQPRTKSSPSIDLCIEFLSVAKRAIQLVKGWRLTTIQILSAFLALYRGGEDCSAIKEDRRGIFFQVSTGSGKSAMIAILAAAKALLWGLSVDVYTHNPLLAKRDAEEWTDFYKAFHITCSHNADEKLDAATAAGKMRQEKGQKPCYNSHIVYGDTHQFQFDTLRTVYLNLGTREKRHYECAIIDEVDSIWIDDAEKLTILSSLTAGMDLLQPLYHHIWEAAWALNESVNLVQIQQSYFTHEGTFEKEENGSGSTYYYTHSGSKFTEEQLLQQVSSSERELHGIHDRRAFLREKLLERIQKLVEDAGIRNADDLGTELEQGYSPMPKLLIPNNLRPLAKSQVENWAESALTALFLEEGKDYVIVEDDKVVMPLDPNNGTTMEMSSWSNGLHQFLQIKHGLKFTPETLQTAFISINALMRRYREGELLGFSGTLQGTENHFQKTHRILVIKMPDLHHNCFRRFPPIARQTRKEWREEIIKSVEREATNGRAVLIICQSINVAIRLKDDIQQMLVRDGAGNGLRITLHVRSDDDKGSSNGEGGGLGVGPVENFKAEPGDVIITTLLGARGMDIKGREIEPYGGLHVILTFPLVNQRLEAQAFGRTARQGNYGTGQYILKDSKAIVNQDLDTTSAVQSISTDEVYLLSLERSIFPILNAKDYAFGVYADAFCSLSERIGKGASYLQKAQSKLLYRDYTEGDLTVLDAYQEFWALGLSITINSVLNSSDNKDKREQRSASQKLRKKLMRLIESLKHATAEKEGRDLNESPAELQRARNMFALVESPFYPTRFAFYLYNKHKDRPLHQTTEDAWNFFKLAIKLDANHSAGAFAGLAYLALMGQKQVYVISRHTKGYKTLAKDNFESALRVLLYEIAALQELSQTKFCLEASQRLSTSSAYNIQLSERLRVLNRYAGILCHGRDYIEETFRPVSITTSLANMDSQRRVFQHCKDVDPLPNTEENRNASFTIEVHGLRWKKDLREYHEVECCVKGLNVTDKRKKRQTLVLLNFLNRNVARLKAQLALPVEESWMKSLLKETEEHEMSLGRTAESLQGIKDFKDIQAIMSSLKASQDILFQVRANRVMSLLELLHTKDVDASKITFRDLDLDGLNAIVEALPKRKDPIQQVALSLISDMYGGAKLKSADVFRELKQRGLYRVAHFCEAQSWRPTSTVILAVLATSQLAATYVLFQTGGLAGLLLAPVLQSGAISDFASVFTSIVNRDLSWKSFAINKMVATFVGVGVGGGFGHFVSLGTATVANAGAEGIVSLVAPLDKIDVGQVLMHNGLHTCKFLITELAGWVLGLAEKDLREKMYSKIHAVVEQVFVHEEEGIALLARFCATKQLEYDQSFEDEALSGFLRTWAESRGKLVNWRWEGMQEKFFRAVSSKAVKNEQPVLLVPFICKASQKIWNYLQIEDTARDACKTLKVELKRKVNVFDARYILSTFCGFSEEQVRHELNVGELLLPPFPSKLLSTSTEGLVSLTEEQLSEANAVLNKFEQDCNKLCKMITKVFVSSLSNFITDHMIGVFSGVVYQAAYSKQLPSKRGDEDMSPATTTFSQPDPAAQTMIRIPLRKQENVKEAASTSIGKTGQLHKSSEEDLGLLPPLLHQGASWANPEPSDDCRISSAAKTLAEAMFFCAEKKYKSIFFANDGWRDIRGYSASGIFIYKLNRSREAVNKIHLWVKNEKTSFNTSDNGNAVYAALSKLSGLDYVDVVALIRDICLNQKDSTLQLVQALVQELLHSSGNSNERTEISSSDNDDG